MSDWELVNDSRKKSLVKPVANSDWQVVPQATSAEKQPSNESLGMSALKAPFRVGEDLYRAGAHAINSLPGYFNAAKTEIPGAMQALQPNPYDSMMRYLAQALGGGDDMSHPSQGHALMQGLAGTQEGINNLAQLPKQIASYGENRLNLLPKGSAEFVGKYSPQDTTQAINELFGEPKYPGDKLIRGAGRNALNLIGGARAAESLNPMNLTAKNIAKNVVNAEKGEVLAHNKLYGDIWKEAERSGFNKVPVDQQLLSNNLSTIEKYKTPREHQSLENFILNPTLENAQKAQSDMSVMHRKLEEKSRSGSLTSEEQALYKAAKDSEKHIEQNMFKDSSGKINKKLQDQYRKVTQSYRENVVPYKYNESIQKYKAKEMLPQELVNSLSKGEFAAKKGHKHPAIKIRNSLMPLGIGAGTLGVAAPWAYRQMFGDDQASH